MSNGQFEQQFRACATQEGAAYTAARDAIIAMGAAVLPQLAAKAAGDDWREKMAADILTGWITRRALFESVAGEVRAEWVASSGLRPLAGKLSPTKRARVVAALGAEVVPRLLEMLLKTREHRDEHEQEAILLALDYLGDRRAVAPLIALAEGPQSTYTERVFALGTLGTLKDPRAFDLLRTFFADRRRSPSLRSTAVVALGMLEDRRATPVILAALQDPTEDAGFRQNAARALGHLRDPSAAPALLALLRQSPDAGLALTIVQSLGQLGDTSAAAALEEVGGTHADTNVRLAALRARENLLA